MTYSRPYLHRKYHYRHGRLATNSMSERVLLRPTLKTNTDEFRIPKMWTVFPSFFLNRLSSVKLRTLLLFPIIIMLSRPTARSEALLPVHYR